MEEQITKYIQHYKGKDHAITSKELERVFDLKGYELRRIINSLRRKNVPICSNASGYFYPQSPLDIDKTVQSLNSRIIKMKTARGGLIKAKAELLLKGEPL